MKVLVVEEDRVSALILCRTLEKLGHEVTSVTSGEDGCAAHIETPFPLIVTNCTLPGMSGTELCRRVRAAGSSAYTYVVMVTDRESREQRLEALQAGVDDFLLKPLDATELTVRIEVAGRLLTMQGELRRRTREVERMQDDLERQDAAIQETMTLMTVANQRFTELFEGVPAACFSLDEDGCIHAWNRAAMTMFGYEPAEVLTRTIWDVFGAKDRRDKKPNDLFSRGMLEHIFAGESLLGYEVELTRKDGEKLHVICNILPTLSPTGRINGAIAAHIDITERKELQQQVEDQVRVQQGLIQQLEDAKERLERLVVTDGLTGLYNHRHFREMLDVCVSRSRRERQPLSVIMLDVDDFKKFNDTFGHPMGDGVLRTVAQALQKSVRDYDIVARYGGEEFVVLCPNTAGLEARAIGERIRKAVESSPWRLRPVTVSVGVATMDPESGSASSTVDRADRALYSSKQKGRNCVSRYEEMTDDRLAIAA